MPRMEYRAVSEEKGSPPQDESGSGDMKIANLSRMLRELIDSRFDQQEKKLDEIMKMTRGKSQREASLEHDVRQPRLAMEADGPAVTKTHERTEGAATALQAMHGDSCTAQDIQDGPKTSTSFGVKAEPPDLSCREDVLVENGAASPKSCLPSSDMRSPTAAGGLLPTREASTATRTTFNQSRFRFYSIEETDSKTNSRTRILYVSHHSSFLPAAIPAGWSSRQNQEKIGCSILTVQGRLPAYPFLGSCRALLYGEVHVRAE